MATTQSDQDGHETPLGPSLAPKAHQKHAIGPKSSTLFCLVAVRPILVVVLPTFHHLQIGFAYCDTPATNPILGVAMVSRRGQGHCFRCNGVALRPIFQMCPPRVRQMPNFKFLAQFQPLDVKSRAKMNGWDRATCLVGEKAQGTKWRRLGEDFGDSWRLKEELGGRRASMGAWSLQPPFLWAFKRIGIWFFCSLLLYLFVLNHEAFVFCDYYWDNFVIDIWIQGWCSSPLKCHELWSLLIDVLFIPLWCLMFIVF